MVVSLAFRHTPSHTTLPDPAVHTPCPYRAAVLLLLSVPAAPVVLGPFASTLSLQPRLLLTGFGPFPGCEENPSAPLAAARMTLAGQPVVAIAPCKAVTKNGLGPRPGPGPCPGP